MRLSVFAVLLACCRIEQGDSSSSQRGHRRQRNASPPRRQHPAAMWSPRDGSSPNLNMYVDQSDASYYERNDMNPPRLISRSARRQLQSNNNGEGTDKNSMSDLDLIVEEAKLGNDALTRLRRDLLRNDYYDKHVYPFDYAWYGQNEGSRTGIPIELDINFHRVFSVDTINPVLDLVVWFRLEWADPRLTWDPTEYGNMTKVWVWIADGGAGGETSEIWTPDIELWNLESGLSETLDDSYAIVNYDGSIYWSRPGHLRPTCKFYGLNNFPFDELTCTMEFGSWTYSGKYMRLVRGGSDGDGWSLGGSDTAGSSFNEFSFVDEEPINCIEHIYPPYPMSPEEDWPVLMYNVTIGRSWQPYARGYILLQVMLNIVGFAAFWLPPSCGERMSLSITAMLAAVAAEVVIAANLPASAELTWFQKFNMVSLTYAFISLLECVAVLYFFYKKKDNLIPNWYSFARDWYVVRRAKEGKDAVIKRGSELVDSIHHGVKEAVSRRESGTLSERAAAGINDAFDESDERNNTIRDVDENNEDFAHRALKSIDERNNTQSNGDDNNEDIWKDCNSEDIAPDALEPTENANQADLNGSSASISVGDIDFGVLNIKKKSSSGNRDDPLAASFVSALSDDGVPLPRDTPVKESKKPQVRFNINEGTGVRSRGGSIHLQSRRSNLQRDNWMQESQTVVVPRDADDFANEREVESNLKWKKLSAQIDDFARVWIPISYFIALPILFLQTRENDDADVLTAQFR
mmetsp:Transcript_19679/g.30001  ORF Transcript_19679/g.30001 Transcript_19679/m.30001 type:complete len:747 (+) Transcript_19679:202-2442(+)